MQNVAILAPALPGITPEQVRRARMAMFHQMMLIARGYPVDHPAVRQAAEIVASAMSTDPVELEVAPTPIGPAPSTPIRHPRREAPASPRPVDGSSATLPPDRRQAAYARYLRTIFSTQPS